MSHALTATGAVLAIMAVAILGFAGISQADELEVINGVPFDGQPQTGGDCFDGGRWVKWPTGGIVVGELAVFFETGTDKDDDTDDYVISMMVIDHELPTVEIYEIWREALPLIEVRSLVIFAGGSEGIQFVPGAADGAGVYQFLDGQGTGNITQIVACLADVQTTTTSATSSTSSSTSSTSSSTSSTSSTTSSTTSTTASTTSTTGVAPTTQTTGAAGTSSTTSATVTSTSAAAATVATAAPAPAARVAAGTLPVTGPSAASQMLLIGLALAATGLVMYAASVQPQRSA